MIPQTNPDLDTTNKPKHNYIHLPSLDGLRGIAILAVMIFHASPKYLRGGFIGVDIFFVLSGFLITSLLIKEHDSKGSINIKNFYMRRILRLFPALVLFLCGTFIYASLFPHHKNIVTLNDVLIVLFYIANWVRAFKMHISTFYAHTWSLSIEEQFYIFWPPMLIILYRLLANRLYITLIVGLFAIFSALLRIIMVAEGYSYQRLYGGLDTRADSLFIGCFIGFIISYKLFSKVKFILPLTKKFFLPAVIILLLFAYFAEYTNLGFYQWGLFIIIFSTSIVILELATSQGGILRRVMEFPLLVLTGKISYGLYLWHFPVYRVMVVNGYSRIEVLFFGGAITFAIATISYYLIERQFLRLKDRFR